MECDYIIVSCPHCKDYIYINPKEFNCHIFRHGVYKKTNKQINPHMKKEQCDYLEKHNLIYGCGKPFQIVKSADKCIAIGCDYI